MGGAHRALAQVEFVRPSAAARILHGPPPDQGIRRYAGRLLELIRPQSKIQLGSRAKWGTRGKLVRPWNVVENIPRDVLMSKQEKPGRRVVFAKKEPAK